jgi:N-acyl-D-aspartate/D-glutamate deacylase
MTRTLILSVLCWTISQSSYDVVIRGGRVIDPETGYDAVANVGISGGLIARVSQ